MTDTNKPEQKEEHHQTDFGFHQIDEDRKVDEVRHVFDSVAPKYDLMNDLLSFGTHRLWKRRCIREADVRQGTKLLDIASGTGDLAIAFAKRAGAGNVTATDINREMLTIGQKRLRQAGVPTACVVADAEALPFADDAFDVVTVSFGIRNMTHKDRALREMLRVLRPGGRLLVLEFSRSAPVGSNLFTTFTPSASCPGWGPKSPGTRTPTGIWPSRSACIPRRRPLQR